MSCTPYFYIEKMNKDTNKYEKVTLYTKPSKYASQETKDRGYAEVDVWPWNGTHDVFEALKNFPYLSTIGPNLSDEMDEIIKKHRNDELFSPNICCINLADMYIEYYKNPTVVDYDVEWDEDDINLAPRKENPLKSVIDRIESYISLADEMWDCTTTPSDVRLIYWIY